MTTSAFVLASLLAMASAAPKYDAGPGAGTSSADQTAARRASEAARQEDRMAFLEYKARAERLLKSTDPMTAPAGEDREICHIARPMADTSTSGECLLCHQGGSRGPQLHTSHPFDVDHEQARFRSRGTASSLRTSAEVVKRGLFLPGGKVVCLTCHDGRSPWRYKLAIPADALIRDAVSPHDARTYDPALRAQGQGGLTAAAAQRVLPVGTEVSPTPLCKVCHGFD
jgi:hypothetical protein